MAPVTSCENALLCKIIRWKPKVRSERNSREEKISGLFTTDIKEIMNNAIAELQKPGNGITKSNDVVLYEVLEKAY